MGGLSEFRTRPIKRLHFHSEERRPERTSRRQTDAPINGTPLASRRGLPFDPHPRPTQQNKKTGAMPNARAKQGP
eukprot:4163552-Pyramimonas_sp.AAC.1